MMFLEVQHKSKLLPYVITWLPEPSRPPKVAGMPFSLSAIVWDSTQMDYCSLCLTSVPKLESSTQGCIDEHVHP